LGEENKKKCNQTSFTVTSFPLKTMGEYWAIWHQTEKETTKFYYL